MRIANTDTDVYECIGDIVSGNAISMRLFELDASVDKFNADVDECPIGTPSMVKGFQMKIATEIDKNRVKALNKEFPYDP